jgi:RND family efflux transporter MFP subunit
MNPSNRLRKKLFLSWRGMIAGTLLAVVAALGCEGEGKPPEASKPEIEVSSPTSGAVADFEVFTGRTQSIHYIDIRARVTGYLEEAPFTEGEDVKEGDVLFKIDPRPYEAVLAQAEADLNVANSHFQSMQDVYSRDVKSPSATPDATFIQDRDNREEAKATIARAKAARQAAQQNVDYCVIKAPFSGRISRRSVDTNNDVIADNTVLASLIQLDPLYAYFDVDERTLLRIGALLPGGKVPADAAKQLPLTLGLANEKPEDFTHKGTLRIADNKVDATTGTVRMWGVFDNSKNDLRPGLFVRVRMDVGQPQRSLFVAETALGSDQGRKYLYVVNGENKVVYTQVDVGQRKDGLIAVKPVTGYHLTESDQVVVNGLQRVHADMEVEPKKVDMPRVKDPATEPTVVTQKS